MYLFQKTLVAFQNGVISIMEKILPCFPDKLPVLSTTIKSRPPALLPSQAR